MKLIEDKKKPLIQMNIIDRVIGYVDPARGAARMKSRLAMSIAASMGGYNAGKKGRRMFSSWQTTGQSANDDTLDDLPTLRERSRDLVRNTPIAGGAIETKVTSVVGTGLKLQSNIDREYLQARIGLTDEQADEWEKSVEREWSMWSESTMCDAERMQTFYGIQELVFRSRLESGDVVVLLAMIERDGEPYDLKCQVIEADRLCNPANKANTDRMIDGIEYDDHGAPVRYHICKKYPRNGAGLNASDWQTVDAFGSTGRRNVLHIYRKTRPGLSRGVPDLAPVIELIKLMGDYTDSEASAALVSSFFTVFIESEGGNGLAGIDKDGKPVSTAQANGSEVGLGAASIIDLLPGEKATIANPGRPNTAFDGFVLALSRQIGARLNLPYELFVKHFTASYSASRGALIEAWRYFLMERAALERQLCQPVYAALVEEAVARGRIEAKGFLDDPMIRWAFLRSVWIGPAQGNLNPLQEAKADALEEDRGWATAQSNTAKRGGDWLTNHVQRKKEVKLRREAELEPQMIDPNAPDDPVQE